MSSPRLGHNRVNMAAGRSAAAERDRLSRLGVAVGPFEHVAGAVDYFGFADPDGNQLSLYSVLS